MNKQIQEEIDKELTKARNKHKPYNSHHEAYAVILEELDEYWEEVRKKTEKRDAIKCRRELIQVATTAIRAIEDLNL